jgi:hypothetical protein
MEGSGAPVLAGGGEGMHMAFAGPQWIVQLVSALAALVVGAGSVTGTATPTATGGPPDTGRAPGLTVVAHTSWSADLSWPSVRGAVRYLILRDGRLIDDVPARSPRAYTDHLLWETSTYGYEVKALGKGGSVLSDMAGSVTTPARSGSFPRFYGDASFWNTPVGPRPAIDPGSKAMVAASLTAFAGVGVVNNDDQWGIPLAYAAPDSRTYTVKCLLYGCDKTVEFRIPRYARPNTGWDGHLAVFDPATGQELDLWQGAYRRRSDTWEAGGRTATVADWGAACPTGQRCGGGGTGAGFLEFGGVVRPEEIAQGHIDHALVLSSPYVRADFIACPATNYWATEGPQYQDDLAAIPLGAHVQLDPRIDVDAKPWPAWQKVIARALQTYGAFVADVSGTLELRGEANLDRGYDAWARVGMATSPHPSLSNLPWRRFRVLSMTSC